MKRDISNRLNEGVSAAEILSMLGALPEEGDDKALCPDCGAEVKEGACTNCEYAEKDSSDDDNKEEDTYVSPSRIARASIQTEAEKAAMIIRRWTASDVGKKFFCESTPLAYVNSLSSLLEEMDSKTLINISDTVSLPFYRLAEQVSSVTSKVDAILEVTDKDEDEYFALMEARSYLSDLACDLVTVVSMVQREFKDSDYSNLSEADVEDDDTATPEKVFGVLNSVLDGIEKATE